MGFRPDSQSLTLRRLPDSMLSPSHTGQHSVRQFSAKATISPEGNANITGQYAVQHHRTRLVLRTS
jgi:hypothetical protein